VRPARKKKTAVKANSRLRKWCLSAYRNFSNGEKERWISLEENGKTMKFSHYSKVSYDFNFGELGAHLVVQKFSLIDLNKEYQARFQYCRLCFGSSG